MLVVIGDEQIVFAELLGSVLTRRGWTVGAVSATAEGIVAAVDRLRPDLCLVDVDSLASGPDLVNVVRSRGWRTKVIALSSDSSSEHAATTFKAGADGFVTKRGGIDDLLAVVDRVVVGERVVERADRSRRRRCTENSAAVAMAAYLTARERQCLTLLVDGAGTSRMAVEMNVTPLTVRSHIRSILAKLGVHSRLEAATLAVRHGLLEGADQSPTYAPRSPAFAG